MNKAWWIKTFAPFTLRLAMPLRKPWSMLVRYLQYEVERQPVRAYSTPVELERAMKAFQYEHDPLDGTIDYVSHPEYVEWTLSNPKPDGDCDDGHWYVANALKKIQGVEEVYFLSSGFYSKAKNKLGAHATCVYKYGGQWYHYDWRIRSIKDPNDAPKVIATRYTGDPDAEVTFWVWETVGEVGDDRSGWNPKAICPDKLTF